MWFVDITIRPPEEWSPLGNAVTGEPSVRRRAVHQLDPLVDGTAAVTYELDGAYERIETLLEAHDGLLEYEATAIESGVLVYTRFEPTTAVRSLLEIPRRHGIVVDTPVCFSNDGGLRLTLVGEQSVIAEALAAIPTAVPRTIERSGEYRPGMRRLLRELTPRQREILLTALEMGYYEDPRRATYADIATRLDCTKATVGEHLRKAERAVLTGVVP